MPCIAHGPDRYLRTPRLDLRDDGVVLSVRSWSGAEDTQLEYRLDSEGRGLGEPTEGPASPIAASADREAAHGTERAVARHVDGITSIYLVRHGQERLVFRAAAMASAPALCSTPGGTWVAFHHDLREDTLERDVAKWIAVRFVDPAGRVLEPTSPMLGLNRDARGEEQSFEFPGLASGAGGAITLVGRGSHNFWRQDLDHQGFSERIGLTDGNWGSRGRRAAVLRRGDDLWIAFRDRRGIEVARQSAPQGTTPELRQARIDYVMPDGPSRPTWDREKDPARRQGLHTYFGDIQQHSAHSDGLGTADEAYLRARDRYGDDFVALTDHESFLGKRTSPSEWAFLQDVADDHDAPGRFATLLAYEWTGAMFPGPGHKCVYLPRRGLPVISRDEVPIGKDLVQRVIAQGAITGPHHIGWSGCDEEGHDPDGQPVWEICSCHGSYEEPGNALGYRGEHSDQFASVMLQRGHRFGFVAASDSHGLLWHHGECRKRDPYRTGLTAVQARTLDRKAVFDAIKARRCYATSGAKIRLDFRANGQPMGSSIRGPGPLEVEGHVVGEGPLARLELVTSEGVVARGEIDGVEGRLGTTVESSYCYLRVVQHDGEMAWSSPIWLDAD